MAKVKLLLIAEVEVDDGLTDGIALADALHQLDRFRETLVPSQNFGISFYRTYADHHDMSEQLYMSGHEMGEVTQPEIKEPELTGPKPSSLRKGDVANFKTILRAAKDNNLALVAAVRKEDHKTVGLICATNYNEDGSANFAPLGVMVESNPFELFYDPTKESTEEPAPYRRIRLPKKKGK